MKYIKLFLLMVLAVPFISSCSDDDENTAECTVGFETDEITVGEFSDGYVNIPIAVKGLRNGPVRINVSATPTGDTPAVEGENYAITDKTLNINADTLSTGVVNVELRLIDDYIMNKDRQFMLTIESVEGANVDRRQILVTISDNDGDFYAAFAGKWYVNAVNYNGTKIKREITLKAAGKGEVGYGEFITGVTSNLCGYNETLSWTFQWLYDENAEMGEFSLIAEGNVVGNYGGTVPLAFSLLSSTGYLTTGVITSTWAVGDTGIPQTLEFDKSILVITMEHDGKLGIMETLQNITLTRE